MNLNDVALLYAALGVSWASITTYRAAKELVTGKPDGEFTHGKTDDERTAMLNQARNAMGSIPPAVSSLVVGLALLVCFVANAAIWPIGIAKAFRKGKA